MESRSGRMVAMTISVCISTRNRAEKLHRCLASLTSQSQRPNEVIVVDNKSQDDTAEVCKKYEDSLPLRYAFERNIGLPYARNASIRRAKESILAFFDDDCVADSFWVERIKRHFMRHPTSVGVIGKTLPIDEDSVASVVEDAYIYRQRLQYFQYPELKQKVPSGNILDFKNAAFRSDFIKAFRFATSVPFGDVGNEDVEIGRRIYQSNQSIYFDPQIRVFHAYSQTIGRMLQRNFWSGYCDHALLVMQDIDLRRTPHRVPWIRWAGYCLQRIRPLVWSQKMAACLWLIAYPIASKCGRSWAVAEQIFGVKRRIPIR